MIGLGDTVFYSIATTVLRNVCKPALGMALEDTCIHPSL